MLEIFEQILASGKYSMCNLLLCVCLACYSDDNCFHQILSRYFFSHRAMVLPQTQISAQLTASNCLCINWPHSSGSVSKITREKSLPCYDIALTQKVSLLKWPQWLLLKKEFCHQTCGRAVVLEGEGSYCVQN